MRMALTETDTLGFIRLKLKVSIETGRRVEWVSEENYKFKLSKYKSEIEQWLLNAGRFI
jgi:methionyl-tRNA synthetase